MRSESYVCRQANYLQFEMEGVVNKLLHSSRHETNKSQQWLSMVVEIPTNEVPQKHHYKFPQSLILISKWQNCYNNYLQESPANDLLTASASSFLSIGSTNGLRYARAAAIVNTGSRHWNTDPISSIFPMFGSSGRVQRCRPAQNQSRFERFM